MKNKFIKGFLVALLLIASTLSSAHGDDWFEEYGGYYRVYEVKSEDLLFETAREVSKGDQYLSGDNKMYEVIRVNTKNKIAYAEFKKDVTLPEIDKVALEEFVTAMRSTDGLAASLLAQNESRRVGIYCTHTAESYVPTDGSESIESGGGILKVAEALKENFSKVGVEAILNDTSHVPHDAGAYKRSRRTAVELLREQPNALFDVHRDATPAEPYLTEINGEPASKVRLVVGRRNQNFQANEETAQKVKAVADEMYPGLVKDIFYAKGDYNQDLTPRAMLLEMGTYQHSRQRAEKSTAFLSEVLTTVVFGGTFKEEETGQTKQVTPQQRSGGGSGLGIAALLAVVGGGGLAFLFLSSGGREWKSKISNFKEEFNSFLGRKRKK
ncbi:stage II sporulation protein P [Alkaliphilus crotonatoxidans]